LQFSERCQIRYLDNKLSTCTKYCNGQSMSVTVLGCCLCLVSLSAYFFQVWCNKLLLHFLRDWDETWYNCDTMSPLWCIVTYLRMNYPGISIVRSPNLQAGVVVLITAMGKWLLVCLKMAISAGSTQVCHGIALVDVAIFLEILEIISTGWVYDVEFTVMYRNEPKSKL